MKPLRFLAIAAFDGILAPTLSRCGLVADAPGRRAATECAAAATGETNLPQSTMAMLNCACRRSRRAAMAAIEYSGPVFDMPAEMRPWLASDETTHGLRGRQRLANARRDRALGAVLNRNPRRRHPEMVDRTPYASTRHRVRPTCWPVLDCRRRGKWADLASHARPSANHRVPSFSLRSEAQPIIGSDEDEHQAGVGLSRRPRESALAADRCIARDCGHAPKPGRRLHRCA